MRKFKTETRTCPCGKAFKCEQRSNRTLCDEHTRRGPEADARNVRMSEKEAEQKVEALWQERASAFLDKHRPLPPIPSKVLAVRREDMGFDTPQEAIALFSDLHWGSEISLGPTAGLARYNPDIALERLAHYRDSLLRFTQMDQYLITVDTLHVFALGDDIEGTGQMFGSQKLQMAMPVGEQVLSFVDHLSRLLPDLLNRYKKIKVYKVRGNHGRITASAKDDYPPDNLELLAWNNIADRVRNSTGGEWSTTPNGVRCLEGGMIDFYISPGFMLFAEILGQTFALRHGDRMKGIAATYTGLVDSKYRLNAIIGEVVNYYMIAHHHEPQSIENEIGGESIVNGCFVGPSQLSVEMQRPAANIPSQEFFLLHPRHGLTHRHRIRLADKESMRENIEWIGR